MSDYIRRQDAVERMVDVIINEFDVGATHAYTLAEDGLNLPSADVVPVETLQAKISKLKYQMDCRTPNIDYYTGYMSALSTVEGILAGMDREE